MSPAFRKLLLVLGAIVIAAAIAYYPWSYRDELTGSASSAYFLTSIYWAPGALLLGLLVGFFFAFALWPRKPKPATVPPAGKGPKPGPTSFEA